MMRYIIPALMISILLLISSSGANSISDERIDQGTYTFIKKLDTGKTVELIKIHFKNAFHGSSQNLATIDKIQQVSEIDPSIVITDRSDNAVINSNVPFRLADGYEIALRSVDIDGQKAYIELLKNGAVVESKVVKPLSSADDTYLFTRDLGQDKRVELIRVRFKNAFRGADQNLATIDQIQQISMSSPSRLIEDSSDKFIISGQMPLALKEGYELAVKDVDTGGNKVYIELYHDGMFIENSIQIIPPVVDDAYIYQRPDDSLGPVELIRVHFKNIFRGADENLATIDQIRQVSETDPTHLIEKSSDKAIISSETPLKLKEGYELALNSVDIDGYKAYVKLFRNGSLVDDAILTTRREADDTYIYSSPGKFSSPVELIRIHIKNAFSGADTCLMTIDQIRQVSLAETARLIEELNNRVIISIVTPLKLKEGYELALKGTDFEGNKVHLELSRNGTPVDNAILIARWEPDDTYIYSLPGDSSKPIELIRIHFKNAFRGADQNIATVDTIRQVSETEPSLLILDGENEATLTSGSPLKLKEGYELAIKSIDINGSKAYVELSKNGSIIDAAVIIP